MRKEIENIKNLAIRCVNDLNAIYKQIDDNAESLIAAVLSERQSPLYDKLATTAETFSANVDKESETLLTAFRGASRLKAEDANLDFMNVIKMLKPSASEIEEIAKDYANNQTMLRILKEYCTDNKIYDVKLPAIIADRIIAVEKICRDLKDCARIASNHNSPLRTRQFAHVVENFDNIYGADLEIIG